ncbi:MAG: RNA polymerase sigma factor [Planctomycetota bacterium]
MSTNHSNLTEIELIGRARVGDPEARSQLFSRIFPRLQGHIQSKMGSKIKRYSMVDDLCQDVFLRTMKSIHSLVENASYSDFERLTLLTANRQLIDTVRKSNNFAGESNVPGGIVEVSVGVDENMGESILIARENEIWLHSIIGKLKVEYAQVIWLALDGLNSLEGADVLGISPESFRKRHQRAIEALRQYVS